MYILKPFIANAVYVVGATWPMVQVGYVALGV